MKLSRIKPIIGWMALVAAACIAVSLQLYLRPIAGDGPCH
jgi:hypothetical protein